MTELTKFSLFPIGRLAKGPHQGFDDSDFDLSILPFEIEPDVHVEDVSGIIDHDDLVFYKKYIGEHQFEALEHIKYAIIHRYPENMLKPDGHLVVGAEMTIRSRTLVRELAACLRVIRPVSQLASFCEGHINEQGKLVRFAFDNPLDALNLPTSHNLFSIRTHDVQNLRTYAPVFRTAMNGDFWKFRMAVQMYDTGYFQALHWKVRFFLWTSALEALFTTQEREHGGSRVAAERIKNHLGAATSVYPPEELHRFNADPDVTVADVVDELYCLRNHIAHGDKLPDYYYEQVGRGDLNGSLSRVEAALEHLSFVVRHSLVKIMRDNLLPHFVDAASSEAYFQSLQLTRSAISRRFGKSTFTCPQ
jgi:hypothetical protein